MTQHLIELNEPTFNLYVTEEGEFKHQKAQKNFLSSRWESNPRPSEFCGNHVAMVNCYFGGCKLVSDILFNIFFPFDHWLSVLKINF